MLILEGDFLVVEMALILSFYWNFDIFLPLAVHSVHIFHGNSSTMRMNPDIKGINSALLDSCWAWPMGYVEILYLQILMWFCEV